MIWVILYRLSFFNNLEEVSNLDNGSVYEMGVEIIRVVIVSMYLKMIRVYSLREWGQRKR